MQKALFVGHGSPMNALGRNTYAQQWRLIGTRCRHVSAILCISAHWYLKETRVAVTSQPKTIHDFYGFPEELYAIRYDVPGAPEIARMITGLLPATVQEDAVQGLDHGAWSVLMHMFPQSMGIPVFQLSIDRTCSPELQYAWGRSLKTLRSQGVLIIGSGNIVHNLKRVDMMASNGYPWADRFDTYIHDAIIAKDHRTVREALQQHEVAPLAVPIRDHFDPLLYVLGATDPEETVTVFNHECTMGSISMTSYCFG